MHVGRGIIPRRRFRGTQGARKPAASTGAPERAQERGLIARERFRWGGECGDRTMTGGADDRKSCVWDPMSTWLVCPHTRPRTQMRET